MEKLITVEEVQQRVLAIQNNENAVESHQLEDDLWMEVLLAVSKGHSSSQKLAEEALNTLLADFDRTYQP